MAHWGEEKLRVYLELNSQTMRHSDCIVLGSFKLKSPKVFNVSVSLVLSPKIIKFSASSIVLTKLMFSKHC